MKDVTAYNRRRKFVHYRPDRKIQRTGNSLYIGIPVQYVKEWKLVAGQTMKPYQNEDGMLVFEPGHKPDPYASKYDRKK